MSPIYSNSSNSKSITAKEQYKYSARKLQQRLKEAGLNENRFIPVEYQNGHKKPTEKGWKNTQYPAREIDGPAGVACGDGLVVVDDDTYKSGVTAPDALEELPETFTVETMHGGGHRYYLIQDQLPSSSPGFGDIQSTNSMVVAPGSEFSHDECDRDKCQLQGVGGYTVTNDAPIATISTQNHPEIFGINTGIENESSPVRVDEITFDGDIDNRLSFAVKQDEKFSELWSAIKNGTTTNDRSAIETALAQKLMFYFEGDESKVRKVMDKIHPPKWTDRGESYQNSVIQSARRFTTDIDTVFNPNKSNNGERSVTQHNAVEIILTVVYQMDNTFTTNDVSAIQRNVGYRQTVRVLNDLEDAGYLTKTHVGENNCWKQVSEIPEHGSEYEMIINQYNDLGEVNQQRAQYLN